MSVFRLNDLMSFLYDISLYWYKYIFQICIYWDYICQLYITKPYHQRKIERHSVAIDVIKVKHDDVQKAFYRAYFFSFLADAVMTNFPTATELDLRNAIGQHFKQAPGRVGGGGIEIENNS